MTFANENVNQEETRRLTTTDDDLEDLISHDQQKQVVIQPENSSLVSYLSLLCQAHSRLCFALALVAIACVALVFSDWAFNPTEVFGNLQHDYTAIQSASELDVADIDHWCITGDSDSCACENPVEPQPRSEFKSWTHAHMLNKKTIQQASNDINVAFLGSSVVEEMDGRWMGLQAPSLKNVEKTFYKHFEQEDGKIKAVALGVAGDASPNVLWRFLNGEGNINPKIWWISLGMNDLARMKCSEEVVVMGILNVVEVILATKPDAKVVVNSLLPMAEMRGGAYPGKQDFMDAIVQNTKEGSNIPVSSFVPSKDYAKRNGDRSLRQGAKPNNSNKEDDAMKVSKREKRKFEKKVKHDRINPKLKEFQTKMKKYDAKKLFLHKNRLPLWTSIVAINKELKAFCRKHDNVEFFDATPLFTEPVDGSQDVLLSNMISVRGHPTEDGYKAWQDAVKAKLDKMLTDADD